MTEEELTAIEARANAATREPWVVGDAYVPTASLSAVSVYGMGMEVAECQMPADGTFIAAARVDVPALVAEVRRLRAELGAAYGHDYAKANPDAYTALHDALIVAEGQRDQAKMRAEKAEAERDALKAELAKVPTLDGALFTPCNSLEVQP